MVKRASLTQESLLGSVARLLKKKSFTEITVSELTKVAGISRMTFYRHYQNIVDVLMVEMKTVMQTFNETMDFSRLNEYEYILQMIQFFDAHRDFVLILVQANQLELLRGNITKVISELSADKPQVRDFTTFEMGYYAEYHGAGLMSVIIDWIANERPETPLELATFLAKNVQS